MNARWPDTAPEALNQATHECNVALMLAALDTHDVPVMGGLLELCALVDKPASLRDLIRLACDMAMAQLDEWMSGYVHVHPEDRYYEHWYCQVQGELRLHLEHTCRRILGVYHVCQCCAACRTREEFDALAGLGRDAAMRNCGCGETVVEPAGVAS